MSSAPSTSDVEDLAGIVHERMCAGSMRNDVYYLIEGGDVSVECGDKNTNTRHGAGAGGKAFGYRSGGSAVVSNGGDGGGGW